MYNQLKASPPTAAGHPHLFAWFCLVAKFSDAVRGSWGAAGSKGGKQEKKGGKQEKKQAETKKKADDDEMDLFGDDDDDEVRSALPI